MENKTNNRKERKMKATKTDKGWLIEITNMVNDISEQGGVCGRKVLYYKSTLAQLDIDYESDPAAPWNDGCTVAQYLQQRIEPDRIIRRGTLIQ